MDDRELREFEEELHERPNRQLLDWLMELAADMIHGESHRIKAAIVVVECGDCQEISMRGFRDGKEANPDPLLAAAVLERARAHGRGKRGGQT